MITKHTIEGVEIHIDKRLRNPMTTLIPHGWDGDEMTAWRNRNKESLDKLRVKANGRKEDNGD